MPRRRRRVKTQSGGISDRDIEALRRAIHEGFPWLQHSKDNVFRVTNLTTRQNILLSYVTGVTAGAAVFLAGDAHPSRETVKAVKAQLKDDIAEAEKRYKDIFIGKHHSDAFFRYLGPLDPPRAEF